MLFPSSVSTSTFRAGEPAVAGDDFDALFLQQPNKPTDRALNGLGLAGQRRLPIQGRLFGHDSELSGVRHGGEDLGDVEPLLGGDAAPDETGASGTLVVDECHGQAEVLRYRAAA